MIRPVAVFAASATLAASLAGCMGPRPLPPAAAKLTVPREWRHDPGMAGVDLSPDWWQRFGDPVLARLVGKALAHNTDIGEAAARVAEAEAQVRGARAAQLPQVQVSGTGYPRERILSQTTLTGTDLSEYEVQASASYDADIFGRLRDQTGAARDAYLAQAATADGVRIAVVAAVVANYLQLRTLDATAQILDATHADLARELTMREHERAEGQVAADVVLQARAALGSVELQQAQNRQQVTEQENALALLLGENPQAIPRGTALMDLPLLPAPATVPSLLLRRRPDIAAAEERLIGADRSLSASRKAFLPDFSLGATLGRVNADVFPAAVNLWSLFGSVLAPIFEGGKLRANADAAAARRDQAAFAFRATALNAFRDVENDLSALTQTTLEERAAVSTADADAGVLDRARHRFDVGQDSYFAVIDAERTLLQARQSVIQARSARLAASVRLYQALGGGWPGLDSHETKPARVPDAAPAPSSGQGAAAGS